MAEPIETPVVATPEPAAPGAASSTSAAADADSADLAAALAIFAGAETPATEAAPAAPAAAPAKLADAPVVPAPKAEPDADTKAILARMARLEFEAEAAREEANGLRGGKDAATKWTKIQELKAARNFKGVLTELGVTADELQTMVLEGDKPLDPEVIALKKQSQELAEFKAQLQAREQAAQRAQAQTEFKRELAPQIKAEEFPLSRTVYGDGVVDEVFAVLQHMYNQGDKNPSVKAAAKVVEDYVAGIQAKLAPPQAGTTAPAAARPNTTTTLTNTPTTAPRVAIDLDTEEGRYEAALNLLKGN